MPPKAKFTRDQIIEAALKIIRENDFDSLSARAIGKKLGSSSCPIFTAFESMEDVRTAAIKAAKNIYGEYIANGLEDKPAFKGVGKQYIRFAICEPMLFRLLFMSGIPETPQSIDILMVIDENYEQILASIKNDYGLSREKAEILYRHMWIYTHGIASLCATKMCAFSEKDISDMMTDIFIPLLKNMINQGG